MFWYYKYPLLMLFLALLVGCCVYVWRGFVPQREPVEPESGLVSLLDKEGLDTPLILEGGEALPVGVEEPEVVLLPQEEEEVPEQVALPSEKTEAVKTVEGSFKPADFEKSVSQPVAEVVARAEKLLASDNPRQARELAYQALEDESVDRYSAAWYALADIVNRANKIFMSGKAPCPEKKKYTIVKGDALVGIAWRMNSTVGGLQRLNLLRSTSAVIQPGQVLQYIEGKWSIRVSKSQFLLTLLLDDKIYRIYRISTGRQDRTPVGKFEITQKQPYPAWTPSGENIPYGDPRNILGTRWMGMQPVEDTDSTLSGYGIHGTTEPEKIGQPASLGCIRMLNEEVEELYDFIPSSFAKEKIYVTITE